MSIFVAWKKDPQGGWVQGRFDWLRRDFVVVMGGAYAALTWVPLAYGDRPIISFARDEPGISSPKR